MLPDYKEIYTHNRYEIILPDTTSFYFSLHHLPQHSIFTRPFAIVTAFNPQNKVLSKDENMYRDRELYSKLYSYETLKATGCYEEHSEPGYLVFDISLESAIALGREFEQFAIFYYDRSCLMYLGCEKRSVIVSKKIDSEESIV